ncbi:MAG TPA: carbon-nitrogen hydrolase family protein [Chthonomonadales bacterium]|nr:carbon-nitrogen hydrolase family protein [Chthonomonadales bacterium]
MSAPLVGAVVQMDIQIGAADDNLAAVLRWLDAAASHGAALVIFPECALSGYCFDSREEALPYAEPAGAPRPAAFARRCAELGVCGVLGFLERDGERLYNAALVAGADGSTWVYRKTHLPTLGVDRYVDAGDALTACGAPGFPLGVLICYDVRFPEPARVLALNGAEAIAVPTNWPEGAESSPEYLVRARARENRIWILAANRVGVERGRRFIGRSQIVDPLGNIVSLAPPDAEEMLFARIDPAESRCKRVVIEPGVWEQDTVGDRRPDLYARLSEGS